MARILTCECQFHDREAIKVINQSRKRHQRAHAHQEKGDEVKAKGVGTAVRIMCSLEMFSTLNSIISEDHCEE